MRTKHSKILEAVLQAAQQHVSRLGGGHVPSVDHLFLAILKEDKGHAVAALRTLLSAEEVHYAVLKIEQFLAQKPMLLGGSPAVEKRLHDVTMLRIEHTLREMYLEMLEAGQKTLHTGHFLLTILKEPRNVTSPHGPFPVDDSQGAAQRHLADPEPVFRHHL